MDVTCKRTRERERDRQTDRQTDRETERETERTREREMYRKRESVLKAFNFPFQHYCCCVYINYCLENFGSVWGEDGLYTTSCNGSVIGRMDKGEGTVSSAIFIFFESSPTTIAAFIIVVEKISYTI